MSSVKGLVESGRLDHVPLTYAWKQGKHTVDSVFSSSDTETVPTIDFSLLTSGSLEERSEVVKDLGDACQDWGFFIVKNHGIPKKLKEEMISHCESFFNLPEEEKQEYAGKNLFDPIRYGTSFNESVEKTSLWRDYLKIHVHPHFSAPRKPPHFSDVMEEYCQRTREVASELLKGISESLGMEEKYINKTMEMEKGGHQLLVANFYPPCPQPEKVIGLPPHSDHGLLTILIQNQLGGLQVMHNSEWVPINPLPDAMLVNTGDQMEILTNGKYKSVVHRAVVNNKATRISIGTAHGPPLETTVSPAPEFTNSVDNPPAYHGITYKDYIQLQQNHQLDGKTCLDRIQIMN